MRLKTALTAESVLDIKKADHYGAHFVHDFVTDQHMFDQIHELFTTAPYEYSHSLGRANEPYNSYPARSESSEEQKSLQEIVHNHFKRGFGHLFEAFKLDQPTTCHLLRYNEHTPEDSDLHVTRDADNDSPVINVVYSINSAITSVEDKSSINTGVLAMSKYKGGLYPNNTTRDVAYYPIPHNSLYYIPGSHIHHGIAKTFCNRYVIVLSYRAGVSNDCVNSQLKRPALPVEVHQCKQCYNYYLSQDVLRTHVQTHISNDNRRDRQRAERSRVAAEKEATERAERGDDEAEEGMDHETEGEDGSHHRDGAGVMEGLLCGVEEQGAGGDGAAKSAAMPVVEAVEDVAAAVVAAAVLDVDGSDSEDSSAVVKVFKKEKLLARNNKRKLGKISEEH
jgi:hypothetical protein